MSDIIQDANRLLEGTTPAPWITGGKDESGNVYVGNPSEDGNLVATSGVCDAFLVAAAPGLAQALAEESYEYAVEEKWLTNDGPVWRAVGNRWHLSMSAAQSDAVQYCQTRIVRRRVSPPEVIE